MGSQVAEAMDGISSSSGQQGQRNRGKGNSRSGGHHRGSKGGEKGDDRRGGRDSRGKGHHHGARAEQAPMSPVASEQAAGPAPPTTEEMKRYLREGWDATVERVKSGQMGEQSFDA